MDNLINFEDESFCGEKKEENKSLNSLAQPLLVSGRLSLDLNNPFDKLEYRCTHIDDPFDCLETRKEITKDPVKHK
jgi:hypothetical protein